MFIKNKSLIIVLLALLYSFIFTIPNVIVKFHSPTSSVSAFDYKSMDDALYGAYYKDVQEGNFKLTDSVNYEHKNVKMPWASIPFLLIGGLAHLLNSIDYSLIILVAVFSFLNFFIQYAFLKSLTKNSLISILGVFAIPLSHVFFTSPSRLLFFLFNYPLFDRFLWTSIPRRQIEIFFLFLPIYLFYLAYTKQSKMLAVISGIFAGLASNTYIYYYLFEMTGIFLLLCFEYYKDNTARAKIIFYALITSAIFSLPYYLKTQTFKSSFKHSMEYLSRLGLVSSKEMVSVYVSLFFILFLIIFLLLIALKQNLNRNVLFLSMFFIGNMILYNQHIITGIQLQTWHWLTVTGRPWMMIMMIYLLNIFITGHNIETKPDKRKYDKLIVMLIFFIIAWSLWANIGVALNLAPHYTVDKEYHDAFDWLNKNTPKDSVVLSPNFVVSENIPLRTHNRVYLVNGFDSAARDCELMYRGIVTMKLFNMSEEVLVRNINESTQNSESLGHFLFHLRYYPNIPEGIKQNLLQLYRLSKVKSNDVLQFKLDYVLIGPKEKALGKLSNDIPMQKVYSTENLEIYEVIMKKSKEQSELFQTVCH